MRTGYYLQNRSKTCSLHLIKLFWYRTIIISVAWGWNRCPVLWLRICLCIYSKRRPQRGGHGRILDPGSSSEQVGDKNDIAHPLPFLWTILEGIKLHTNSRNPADGYWPECAAQSQQKQHFRRIQSSIFPPDSCIIRVVLEFQMLSTLLVQ